MNRTEKIQGCILGLAVGDALGGPAEGKNIEDLQKTYGRIEDFLTEDQAGSDDTDFALFNAVLLLKHGEHLTSDIIADAWLTDIAEGRTDFKGAGFSTVLAIANLRKGIRPPQSGVHLHSWSDGLAMRVAPFGVFHAGSPEKAAGLAELDGYVSDSGEGILAGKVVAATIALVIEGSSPVESIKRALRTIPSDSWTYRAIEEAMGIAQRSSDVWEAVPLLHQSLACTYFPWADLAPEAVGIAFGLVTASRRSFRDGVLGGVNIGRDADTIAAIVGAVLGADVGLKGIPSKWIERVRKAKGLCITSTAGIDLIEISQKLADLVSARRPV